MTEQPQPQKEAAFFSAIRQWGLTRGDHGVIGGVVEGTGARVGLAAVPSRLIVVLAWFLLPGLVMLGYAAAWGLLPDRRGNIIIQNFGRGVTNVGALLGIAVLTLFGFGGLSNGPIIDPFGWDRGSWVFGSGMMGDLPGFGRVIAVLFAITIPLLLISGVIVLIVWLVKRSNNATPQPGAGSTITAPDAPNGAGGAQWTWDATMFDGAGGWVQTPRAAGEPSAASAPTPATDTAPSPDARPTSTQDNARASAGQGAAVHAPQPWEPALLPGDPRAAGASQASAQGSAPGAPPAPPTPGAPMPFAPGASGASIPPAPPAPAYPATPPRPHVPGPGKGGYLAFLGVLLVTAAVVIGLERADRLAVNPVLAWGAAITVGLGAVLIVVALTGRKLGFLGFLSVVAVLAGVPLAANADGIRADHGHDWGWWDVDVTIGEATAEVESSASPAEPAAPAPDLTEPFTDDYAQVFISSGCWALSAADDDWASGPEAWSGNGQASIRLTEVTDDTTVQVSEGATTVTVPAGTSISVAQTNDVYLEWDQRDLACDLSYAFSDVSGAWLSATNPGEPVVEIEPTGTGAAVFIKEEQS